MTRVRHATGRRRRKPDDPFKHEAWAIPYADLLTLLLAFFVVMYAISSVNAGKYRVLSDSLFAAFRGAPRSMQPIQVGDRQVGTGPDLQTTVVQQSVLDSRAQTHLAPVPVAIGMPRPAGESPVQGKLPPQAAAASAALSRLADEVARSMQQLVQKDMVKIRRSDFWIEVEMRTDILFPSGSARLADEAVNIIEHLGGVLAPFPNPIRVEGYTDNKPINTAVFYSNWELSAARAGSVVRVLSSHGVTPERLAVIGYGEQRPLMPNDTVEGRNANRRVVVVILSTELVRQMDPSKAAATDSANPAINDTPAGAVRTQTGDAGGIITSPAGGIITSPASGIITSPADGIITSPAGGALASPAGSPQGVPAPAPAPAPAVAPVPVEPATQPAAAQTAGAGHQHNTGTEPAP